MLNKGQRDIVAVNIIQLLTGPVGSMRFDLDCCLRPLGRMQ